MRVIQGYMGLHRGIRRHFRAERLRLRLWGLGLGSQQGLGFRLRAYGMCRARFKIVSGTYRETPKP